MCFINWLNNGQPVGPQDSQTTEDGSYTLNGATSNQCAEWCGSQPRRDVVLALRGRMVQGGISQERWPNVELLAVSDIERRSPLQAAQPPGTAAPTPSNTANFRLFELPRNGWNDGYAMVGVDNLLAGRMPLSEVGAYSNTVDPYGTFDQGGNVLEWTENKQTQLGNSYRALRGGSWINGPGLISNERYIQLPTLATNYMGFRVAGFAAVPVPEPATIVLAAIGSLVLAATAVRVAAFDSAC